MAEGVKRKRAEGAGEPPRESGHRESDTEEEERKRVKGEGDGDEPRQPLLCEMASTVLQKYSLGLCGCLWATWA